MGEYGPLSIKQFVNTKLLNFNSIETSKVVELFISYTIIIEINKFKVKGCILPHSSG